jgi:D-glycero-alpha-D-manno-heptose-7-phosphate kinase
MRIAFGGGGTDLPSYYEKFGGYVVSGAINKYVYMVQNYSFHNEIILKYSHMERVNSVDKIKHPLIRECMKLTGHKERHLELAALADIPGGTGLGSSSSFTCALLHLLHTRQKQHVSQKELAEQAFEVEVGRLKAPIGKQDQYIASYGGLKEFVFMEDGKVKVSEMNLPDSVRYDLEDNLMLFFTGYTRIAGSVLKEQDDKSKAEDPDMLTNLHLMKDFGMGIHDALKAGDLEQFAYLMNLHWEAKKKRSASMTNDKINTWYEYALKNGALGGRLVGAGGGGFLLFYADNTVRLRAAMKKTGLEELRFRFDRDGTKVVEVS